MIVNSTKGSTIAEQPVIAQSMFSRMRGMLGRSFDGFDAMVFEHNNSIHMFFMHMPLDILFLDKSGKVVGLRHGLKPWRMAAEWRSSTVVELPVGVLAKNGTAVGDEIAIEAARNI